MVVILSYNHPHITARCVSSVLKKVPSDQVALVHNGSEVRHLDFLKELFPHIYHWEIPVNCGYSGGVNEGLKRGFKISRWVFFLTNDTEVLDWNLTTEALSSGLYSPHVWFRREGRVDFVGGLFDSSVAKLHHLSAPVDFKELKQGQFFYAPGTAFLMSQDIFEKVGPFDEFLHTYWEDVDFGARATRAGVHFGHLPGIKIVHQGRKTTGKSSYYTKYLFKRNRRLVSWRYCPWFLKPRLLIKLFFPR